jgi:S1-C subfamily serine protease
MFVRVYASSETDTKNACGTGFFINNTGLLATVAHVPGKYNKVVFLYDKQWREGTVVNRDRWADVALIQTAIYDNSYYLLNSSWNIGSITIEGWPVDKEFSFDPHVESGYAYRGVTITGPWRVAFMAHARPGNSGGPIINADGEVVGIVSHAIPFLNWGFGPTASHIHNLTNDLPTSPSKDGEKTVLICVPGV